MGHEAVTWLTFSIEQLASPVDNDKLTGFPGSGTILPFVNALPHDVKFWIMYCKSEVKVDIFLILYAWPFCGYESEKVTWGAILEVSTTDFYSCVVKVRYREASNQDWSVCREAPSIDVVICTCHSTSDKIFIP